MAKVNPSQVAHIRQHQPDFQFRERDIQPSLESARTDDLLQPDKAPQSCDSSVTINSTDNIAINDKPVAATSMKHVDVVSKGDISSDTPANTLAPSTDDAKTADSAVPPGSKIVSLDEYRLIRRVRWLVTRLIGDKEMDYLERKRGTCV